MDSVTHIFLGGCVGQVIAGRRAGFRVAFLLGALAATLPDADVLIRTGNTMRDHALHRHFTHALVLTPVLAMIALLPFWWRKDSRPVRRVLFLAALAACLTHLLLDALTSYGTMLLWPFTDRRYAFDVIAVVDPVYTIGLIAGGVIAMTWRRARAAAVGLVVSTAYLGFGGLQHERAYAGQGRLLAARQVTAVEARRVMPQLGSVLLYRSIYMMNGEVHGDAIRVPLFSGPMVKPGGQLRVARVMDLEPFPVRPEIAADFDSFVWFSDGYVARSPQNPLVLGDLRYATTTEGMEPLWGLQLERTERPVWHMSFRTKALGRLWGDLVRPAGYSPIPP